MLDFILPAVTACPAPPPADPAIAFMQPGTVYNLMVMNVDGSNKAVIFSGWQFCLLTYLSWSPDGKSITFTNPCDPDGSHYTLWRVDVAIVNGVPKGINAHQLSSACVSCSSVAWSPTENLVAVISNFESILLIDADTGVVVQTLYTTPSGTKIFFLAWNSNGTRLAVGEDYRRINIIDRASGGVIRTLNPGSQFAGGFVYLSWARQGVDKLVIRADIDPNTTERYITIVDIATETYTRVAAGSSPAWSPDNTKLVFQGASKSNDVMTVELATGKMTDLKIGGYYNDWRRF